MYFDYRLEPVRDILFIDMKSFYASVECQKRGLDPLTTMLVVMSTGDNTGNGLVLAASPMAKKKLGVSNVTRADNLPNDPDLIKVSPRMTVYIEENLKINDLFREFVAEEDLLIYSIDESILDVTASLNLFFPDKKLTRQQKRWRMARKIQRRLYKRTGLYCTVGIGDNPLLAKLALDNSAKHTKWMIDEWTYKDVQTKVWKIDPITDFWGIGHRTQKRLYKMGIDTIEQLATTSPLRLKKEFGVIGEQLHAHANGIDRTILSEPAPEIAEKSYGNSQVLNRNYSKQSEIEIVVKEMAEQVATRIRRHNCMTQCISLYIGSAHGEANKGFSRQMKIPATDNSKQLVAHCLFLFRKHYQGQVVRHVGVSYSKLIDNHSLQLDLFSDPDEIQRERHLDQIIDRIREKYGFTSIVHANSMLPGGRAIARSGLVGGHAGGMDGINDRGTDSKQTIIDKKGVD